MNEPRWTQVLARLAAIATGVFMAVHETLIMHPREIVLYVAALLIVGPTVLKLFGK